METVYLETTIFSYLVARPSRDVVVAGHQRTTADWWANRRQEFICVVSDFLVTEISRGDAAPSAVRLRLAEGLPRLQTTPRFFGWPGNWWRLARCHTTRKETPCIWRWPWLEG